MRARVLDWLRVLELPAEVHSYLGTANARPGTLMRHPVGVLRAEARLALLGRAPAPERLMISRAVRPFTRGHLEARLLRRAGWGVYDFDDALFADDRGGVHRFLGEATGWATAVGAADLVIAGNSFLADAAARFNPHVEVIPTCIDPAAYPVKHRFSVGAPPRLVWLGSPFTEAYVEAVAPALLEVHRRTGARLTLISAGDRPLGDLDAMTDRVPWSGVATDALLAEADVGLMPLPDTPFARGKCAYKLLQYGAAGLPAVATPIGVNEEVVTRLACLGADDLGSWTSAVMTLLEEPDADRRERGLAARRAVEVHYSYDAWRPAFLRALALPDPPGSARPVSAAAPVPATPGQPR